MIKEVDVLISPEIVLIDKPYEEGNTTEEEQRLIMTLARDSSRILEIGTFRGRSAANFIVNCLQAEIVTVNLEEPIAGLPGWDWRYEIDRESYDYLPLVESKEVSRSAGYAIRRFHLKDEPEVTFTQIIGDSRHLQELKLAEFDFIFIDGNHSFDVVMHDLVIALSLLTPKGILLCHDYSPGHWNDVVVAIELLADQGYDFKRIKGSNLALLKKE